MTTEQLIHEFITAIENGKFTDLEDRLKTSDGVFLDNIQFLTGKPYMQEEIFSIMKSIYERQRQIVMTCDRWPGEIPDVRSTLISRFRKNLIADIQPPEMRLRFQ